MVTLKGTPARNGLKYFSAPTKDNSSRSGAAFLRSAELKLFERNSMGRHRADSSGSVWSYHRLCLAAHPDASHRSWYGNPVRGVARTRGEQQTFRSAAKESCSSVPQEKVAVLAVGTGRGAAYSPKFLDVATEIHAEAQEGTDVHC